MRSTFFGLETGKRALQTHQREQDTIGHNVSNAATEGYSRQRAGTASTTPLYPSDLTRLYTPGQIGTGVTITDVSRIRDLFIDIQVRRTSQGTGFDDVAATALRQLESTFNEPGEEGISHAMNNFFNHWQELTKQPENIAVRTALREVANTLVDVIHQTNYNIRQIQIDADTQMKQKMNRVNGITAEIASLNQRIAKAVNHNDNPNDLYDKRDLLVDDLSDLLEIQVLSTEQGQIAVLTGGGSTLVRDDKQFALYTTPNRTSPTVAATRNEKTAVFSRIISEDNQNEVYPASGELGGHIAIRDTFVPKVLDRLDEFVEGLIIGVNSVHSRGFGLDGTTRLNFFADDQVVIPQTGVLNPTWRHTNTGTVQFPQNPPITTNALITAFGATPNAHTLTINKTRVVNSSTTVDTININVPAGATFRDVLELIETNAGVEAYYDIEAGRVVIQGKQLQQTHVTFGVSHDVAALGAGPAYNLNLLGIPATAANPIVAGSYTITSDSIPDEVTLVDGRDYSLDLNTGVLTLTASGQAIVAANGNTLFARFGQEDGAAPVGQKKDFFTATGLMSSLTTITSTGSDASSRMRVADEIQADVNRIAAAPSYANLPGDNTIAVEIARLQNELKLSGVKDQALTVKHTATYTTFFNSTIANLGLDSQAAQKSLANNQLILQEFEKRREEISGVNLDEELTQLIEVQKSYNAAARFVTTTDEMLDTIINRMGIVGR